MTKKAKQRERKLKSIKTRSERKQECRNPPLPKLKKGEQNLLKQITNAIVECQRIERRKYKPRVMKKSKCLSCNRVYIMYAPGEVTYCDTCVYNKKPACLHEIKLIVHCINCEE